jgi:hypothetical protein
MDTATVPPQPEEQHSACRPDEESAMEVDDDDDLPCDVEADDDEEDPEMVACPKCNTLTHISLKQCSNPDCGYSFKFTKSGHLLDGFVVDHDDVEFEEDVEESESELEYEHSDESESDEEDDCPWADDGSDGSWEP